MKLEIEPMSVSVNILLAIHITQKLIAYVCTL